MSQKIDLIIKEATETYGTVGLARKLGVQEQTVFNWVKGKTTPRNDSITMLERLVEPWIKELCKQPDKDLKVLSLFSGCGGMDLGFEGGFDVLSECVNPLIHPEWLPLENRKQWVRLPPTRFKTVFANDILAAGKAAWAPYFTARGANPSQYHLESVVDLVKKSRKGTFSFPTVDVVTGGFPCQDFSVAGKRKGFSSKKAHHGNSLTDIDNPTDENRGKLYMWMRHVIEITRPKVFVAENVKGLTSLKDVKQMIENDFRNIGSGYLVMSAKVLFAPNYGVPQTRERIIFIGFRRDALTKDALKKMSSGDAISAEYNPYPLKTHSREAFGNLLKQVTVKQCLKGLPEPDQAKDISQQTYSKAKWYGVHCQGQSEVKLDGLGPTIRAEHHGNIEFRRLSEEHNGKHKEELRKGLKERRLTVRECARIQTFPDDFSFVRPASDLGAQYKLSGSEGYKIIGNAVPPLLAAHIAWRLQELWPKIMKDD